MKLFAARCISILFHPLALTFPSVFIVVFRESGSIHYSFAWVVITSFFVLIYGLLVMIGVRKKYFKDFDVSKQRERFLLYLIASGVMAGYLLVIILLSGPIKLFLILSMLFLGILFLDVANLVLKASIHTATITAFAIAVATVYDGIFFLILLAIPLVIWSRIVLKKHTLSETFFGSVFGAILILIIFMIHYI